MFIKETSGYLRDGVVSFLSNSRESRISRRIIGLLTLSRSTSHHFKFPLVKGRRGMIKSLDTLPCALIETAKEGGWRARKEAGRVHCNFPHIHVAVVGCWLYLAQEHLHRRRIHPRSRLNL
ncbi:hypothetical protein ABW19_dt0209904 [Dactylella cylindrospora]|nr:hypothetical protein ABW19_dt0209904 [Dactylella cylindrospora]